MAKVKVNPTKEHPVTLKLTAPEMEVVAALISHVRLGHGDVYTSAASDLCNTIFSSDILYDYIGNLDEPNVQFGFEIEVEEGNEAYVTLNLTEKFPGRYE